MRAAHMQKQQQYDKDLEDLMGGSRKIKGLKKFDPTQDPMFASRIAEQTKAIERSGAAKGGLLGGGTLASLREMTAGEMGAA